MSERGQVEQIRIVCTECPFSKLVPNEGQKPADVIIEHGQETGHTLVSEEPEDG
jgi:hypothetical protein